MHTIKALLPWLWVVGVTQAAKKPNILFILTDDQDLHMESVEHMPYLNVGTLIPELSLW